LSRRRHPQLATAENEGIGDRRHAHHLPTAGNPNEVHEIRADLDGDRKPDLLRIYPDAGKMTLTLANSTTVRSRWPQHTAVSVLGMADIAGDGRDEVFLEEGANHATGGIIVAFAGERLRVIESADAQPGLAWDVAFYDETADVACVTVGG